MLIGRWHDGLVYMAAVMGILLAHEMGHFVQAVRYGVPASLPFFIPMPFTPLGTMGAVIGMQGSEADRKELFDIGLSGPLAGLLVALPITWIGIQQAEPFPLNVPAGIHYQDPLLFKVLMQKLHPELLPGQELTMNPLLMAGWVGMLITGLNMLPISQLDGGHVSYALFGKGSFWIARGVVVAALAFMRITGVYGWMVMLLLVMLIGIQHPPTANDRVELGWGRAHPGTRLTGDSGALPGTESDQRDRELEKAECRNSNFVIQHWPYSRLVLLASSGRPDPQGSRPHRPRSTRLGARRGV